MFRVKTSGYDTKKNHPKGPQGGPKRWKKWQALGECKRSPVYGVTPRKWTS